MRRAIRTLRSSQTGEFLLWCAPALLVALALRIALTSQLPYGCYLDDTHDFLLTPDSWVNTHRFHLDRKKTFLVPIFFTLPFLLGPPPRIAILTVQHLAVVAV